MAKVKKLAPKSRRKEPYPKNRRVTISNDSVSPVHDLPAVDAHCRTAFQFLQLPVELRLKVYDKFLDVTPIPPIVLASPQAITTERQPSPSEKKEYARAEENLEAIKKTRKALLSVCHRINDEWRPLFYGTTTWIVHASKQKLGYFKPKHISYSAHCNPWHFESDFLRGLETPKLEKIKKIDYNPRVSGAITRYWSTLSGTDFESLHDLARILAKHLHRLPSLEQVTLHRGEHCDTSIGRIWVLISGGTLWHTVDVDRNWEAIENKFLGLGPGNKTVRARRQGAGVLEGWDVTRKLELVRDITNLNHPAIPKMSMVFRKRNEAVTTQSM